MQFDYFYGGEAEQFSFFRIPKLLFRDEAFKSVSTDAKVLYGLMLDRMSLSLKNGWLDDEGRVYIIYTIADIMEDMSCADQKAGKLLTELDNTKGIGLIERKRQGLGKPNIIYVKNFVSPSLFLNRENHDSGKVIITNQEMRKSRTNNTDNSNTEYNNDLIDWACEREEYERQIKENIEYDILLEQYDKSWLDEIVAIMVDVVCSKAPYVRINRESFPHEIVKSIFLKIDSTHIEYIHLALRENTSKVRNIRAFLITTIYRSTETADNWISAKVRHDLKGFKNMSNYGIIILEVIGMKKIINPYSIIVSCLLIIIGIILILIKTTNGVSVNIGCSLIASGLVLFFTAILIDYQQEYIAWHEWKLERIFKTRADKNNDSDPKLESHHVKQLDGVAFGLSSFRSNRSDDVLLCMQSGMNVRLLVMDPNSDFVRQREIEEGASAESIAQSILKLVDWANDLNKQSNKGKIQIKFYNAMTLDFYWRMDDELYVGPYLYGVVSQQTITYKYVKGGKGFALYSKYFEKLWNDGKFSYN